jgi:hypothetical protein
MLNVVNEPDFDKKYFYGIDGNTQKNVGLVFEKSVTKFKEMLNDPKLNTIGMVKNPIIMGPSTISPDGCLSYMRYFKANYPNVWKNLDIIAYHQYTNGKGEDVLQNIANEADGKLIYQSEMHTNRGENITTSLPIADELKGCLSLATIFGSSVRTGANSWFYFQTNYPNAYTPAGLMFIADKAAEAIPYKHYYAFKQLGSAQPFSSHRIGALTDITGVDVVAFRKKGIDSLYLHASNFNGTAKTFTLELKGNVRGLHAINNIKHRRTSATENDATIANITYPTATSSLALSLAPYSVNTYAIALSKDPLLAQEPSYKALRLVWEQVGNIVQFKTNNGQILEQLNIVTTAGKLIYSEKNIQKTETQVPVSLLKNKLLILQAKTKLGYTSQKIWLQ